MKSWWRTCSMFYWSCPDCSEGVMDIIVTKEPAFCPVCGTALEENLLTD